MRYVSITIMLSFLVVFVTGCGDELAPTSALDQIPSEAAANKVKHDANIRVTRHESHFTASWTDPDTGLRATHTTRPLGNPTETDCGLLEFIDPIENQSVLIDENEVGQWIKHLSKGEVFIIVRDLNTEGDCFGAELVAQGMGSALYNDNDYFCFGCQNDNAITWSIHGHSTDLYSATDGSRMVYSGHASFLYKHEPGFFKALSAQVTLN